MGKKRGFWRANVRPDDHPHRRQPQRGELGVALHRNQANVVRGPAAHRNGRVKVLLWRFLGLCMYSGSIAPGILVRTLPGTKHCHNWRVNKKYAGLVAAGAAVGRGT